VIGVLIVDDDFMVAKVHAGFVAALDGFEVVGTASTGAQALAEIARLNPDLVLLDVYLPDMTGLDVLRRLRAEGPPVDVIVISAARDVDSIRSAFHGGVLHYLVKPFDRATFEARLRDYAALREDLGELEEAGQVDVDRVFGLARSTVEPPAPPPKGIAA
jgi:response regulator of citrate/malate metabolism